MLQNKHSSYPVFSDLRRTFELETFRQLSSTSAIHCYGNHICIHKHHYVHSVNTHVFLFPGGFNSLFSLLKSSLKMDTGRGGHISYKFPDVNLDSLLEMAERSPPGNLDQKG